MRLAAACLVVAVACGGDDAPPPDSVATAGTGATSGSAGSGGNCPRTGHWGECQLRARIAASGLAIRDATGKVGDLPELAPAPVTFMIGSSGFAAYFYPDSAARRAAASGLDTVKFIPQSKRVGMLAEATVIQNDNLLAILFSRNEHQRERVSDAITAGAPQP